MGSASTMVFGPEGGTIGRSRSNDWTLPDPERYVSGKHAAVEFKDGQFFLVDTSTNGVYVNDSEEPIGRGESHPLRNGDLLRLGAFSVTAIIEQAQSSPTQQDAFGETNPLVDLDSGYHKRLQTNAQPESEPAHVDDVFIPDETGIERSLAVDSPAPVKAQPAAEGEIELLPSNELHSPTRLELEAESPARSSAATEPGGMPPALRRLEEQTSGVHQDLSSQADAPWASGGETVSSRSDAEALARLLKGAGLDASSIPAQRSAEALQVVGQVLRETVLGLMDVLQGRADMKNAFRLPHTVIRPVDNNPLKFSAGVDEALKSILSRSSSKFLPPVDAIRQAFEDIKDHQIAQQSAMRAAFEEFLERFDPEELQEKFNRGLKRGALMGATNKMKYWDLYKELYEVMTQHSQQAFPHLFGEVFARAYEETKEKLRIEREKKLRKEIGGSKG